MNFADCLPQQLQFVGRLPGLRELRLRNGKPAKLNLDGKWYWAGNNLLVTSPERAVVLGDVCNDFIKRACNSSVYAYEKMLAQGFFTFSDGTRVGVCGSMAEGGFSTYTSLCLRKAAYCSCAKQLFNGSVIVVGPPGSGKTTYLRDYAAKLSQSCNVVVVDERGELACEGFASRSQCDVLRFATKQYAFQVALRTLSPDWLVCDELAESDLPLLQQVTSSGVKLAASLHGGSEKDLFCRLGANINRFSYAVFLSRDSFAQRVVGLQTDVDCPQIPQEL